MDRNDEITLQSTFRRSPTRMAMFVVGPLLLAAGQLLNVAFNGFPLWAALAFTAAMAVYSAMYARLHRSQLRLRALERATAGTERGASSGR